MNSNYKLALNPRANINVIYNGDVVSDTFANVVIPKVAQVFNGWVTLNGCDTPTDINLLLTGYSSDTLYQFATSVFFSGKTYNVILYSDFGLLNIVVQNR